MSEAPLEHPGDEALRAMSLGELNEAELVQVSAHLGDCPACCRRIDELATEDRLLAQLQQSAASGGKVRITPAQIRSAVRALRRSHDPTSATRTRDPDAAPVILPAPRQVGDYDILAEVGRGGMGVVYKARHRGLHRLAALKMVLAGEFASTTQELRFRLEAELAARVQHPNIVQVYEIGSYDGRPFLALEWVEGGSLANQLDGQPWPPGEAAALIETLARAIDVAHGQGVVHRDLKPANILLAVEGAGSRVLGGRRRYEQKGERDGDTESQGTGSLAVGNGPEGLLPGYQGLCEEVTHWDDESDSAVPGAARSTGEARLTPFAPAPPTSYLPPTVREASPAVVQPFPPTLPGSPATRHAPRTTGHPSPLISHRSSFILPKIADFGLAQPIEGGQTVTQSGLLVGTPGYMAPEQASGKRALVGPATDIYALGVVLYQLLTGQLPFQRNSTLELLQAVTSEEPAQPRRLQPRLPRDLEAITLHCLEKEPSRRYPSALELAEDLARFREGKQVLARPVGAVARLARACRRRPLVAMLVALLAVSLFGGLAGVTWKWREANEQRDLANKQRDLANEQRDLANANARRADTEKQAALYQAYRASLAAAGAAMENHDVADAERHLKEAPESLLGWEWRHLRNRLDDSSAVAPLPAGEEAFLIPGPDQLLVGLWADAGLRITDLQQWVDSPNLTLHPPSLAPVGPERRGFVMYVAQTSRGLRLTERLENMAVQLLDQAGRVLCRVGPMTGTVYGAIVSPDGTRLGVSQSDERRPIALFDAISGKQTATCNGHGVSHFTFSPDGSRLATVCEDRTARVWDAATGALLATCRGHASKLIGAAFSPDGSRLVTTSADATVRQWDPKTGQEVVPPYDRHSGEVVAARYSPDGQWLASAGTDRTVRVWRAADRQDLAVLHGHKGTVRGLAFSPDGRRLASQSFYTDITKGAGDGSVRIWEVAPRATLPVLRGHTSYVFPVAFSPDGRWLASGGWDNTVRLWDAATGEPCATLPHPSFVWDLAFGPDGTWLVTGCSGSDRLRIWDVATARVRKEIRLPNKDFYTLAVSLDGTRLAATMSTQWNEKCHLNVFDIASGNSLVSIEGATLAYSPDGRWLAVVAADEKTILLLDARTHETTARFIGHEKRAFRAAFSPDSRWLASCGRDYTVRLWPIDPSTKDLDPAHPPPSTLHPSPGQVLRGHTDEIFAVAFHPDGTRLATAGRDGAVWLWDLARGETVVRLPGHKSYIWSLAFSADGATLASGSGDSSVRLWDTKPLKTRYQARREAAALRPQAERLVEALWREKTDPAEVVDAIRANRMPSEALRHAALRAVMRRVQPPEATLGKPHDPP